MPSNSPESCTGRIWGWDSWAAIRISRRNRCGSYPWAPPPGINTLMATFRACLRSSARYTAAIPPCPISSSIRYRPAMAAWRRSGKALTCAGSAQGQQHKDTKVYEGVCRQTTTDVTTNRWGLLVVSRVGGQRRQESCDAAEVAAGVQIEGVRVAAPKGDKCLGWASDVKEPPPVRNGDHLIPGGMEEELGSGDSG